VKKVILDENLPQPLRHLLAPHEVVTTHYMGWSGIQNGELIRLIDADFDVLITADKNLRYQQNLSDRNIAIIELPFSRYDDIAPHAQLIIDTIESISSGSYQVLNV
jgi:hypothetical protein